MDEKKQKNLEELVLKDQFASTGILTFKITFFLNITALGDY